MRIRCTINSLSYLLLLASVWGLHAEAVAVEAEPNIYYIQLIRGTDQERRPEPDWRPIGPKVGHRLSPIFRWKNYWEVNCQRISVESGKISRSRLSGDRQVEIELVNPSEVEIRVYLKGKLMETSRQLTRTRMIIMGGERSKDESWFVVVRRDKPQ